MKLDGVAKNQVIEVKASCEERKAGKFEDETVRVLLDALHHDGVVLLRDVIDLEHLNALNTFMAKEANEDVKKGVNRNFGTGQFSLVSINTRKHSASTASTYQGSTL